LRVEDIVGAIDRIQEYTQDFDLPKLVGSPKVLDAVLYNFVVIGEASRYVPVEVMERYHEVPWSEMRDMRNFLVHEYPGVDPMIVWKTLRHDLPPIRPLLERILEESLGVGAEEE
jgi:uncharacterized protein with HEPN domain